jgi:DNA-binding ferritin-like protein
MNTPQRSLLKRPMQQAPMQQAYQKPSGSSCIEQTTNAICELMNATISFHKLHLKVTGVGSFASHKALNELYDGLTGLTDSIAEGYQGAAETILNYPDCCPRTLNTVDEAINYIRELYDMICSLQEIMCYSEISNELDNVKSLLSSTKYKLLFLK